MIPAALAALLLLAALTLDVYLARTDSELGKVVPRG